MGEGKGISPDWAWVRQEEGKPLTGMNNGTGAEVAGALSVDSALSSTRWLLQEAAPPTCTCLLSLGHPVGPAALGLDKNLASDFPGSRSRASLGRTVSLTSQVRNRPGEVQ